MATPEQRRERMVARQIAGRGIRDGSVLRAMRLVPREVFVPQALAEFAHDDTPLPIEEEQTISQPYIVALMTEALGLRPGDRVLEIGTGSGYGAAVLAAIAGEVYTVERHPSLAKRAGERLRGIGYENAHVLCGDGTLGWPEHAPYDAISVTAGGPEVPAALLSQLAIGGRLVIPVGPTPRLQRLLRVVRVGENDFRREDLGSVQFVPLIGAHGWGNPRPIVEASRGRSDASAITLVREVAERFDDIESADLGPLLDRIGNARVVLLGEATHGTSEFYRMRSRITRELVLRRAFRAVAVEADWPDAARVDRYVRHLPRAINEWTPFARFPTWMWRNEEVHELTTWLREYNREVRDPSRRVGFYGLDLYSLFTSVAAVVRYLDSVDPETAAIARRRYGCLSPWETDPALYGRAAITGRYRACTAEAVAMLRDLLARRIEYAERDGDRFFDAVANARLVANAESYYRVMYEGSVASWNLRDQHMFDTLELLLGFLGPDAKVVVWEHNSHVGDASATEMGARGEHNVGQLCRARFGDDAYIVGFGTDHGTVAAASEWDAPMEVKRVVPAHRESYESLFHQTGVPAFLLPLRRPPVEAIREELRPARLERAIGVIYRPDTELESHYFQAVLPAQFDEYVWFDETHAVTPLGRVQPHGLPETYPFGL